MKRELRAAHMRAARVERAIFARAFRRPLRMTTREWADAFRYLAREESPGNPGKYSSDFAPYQREPMEVMSDPLVYLVVLMWASQLGKSLVISNDIGRSIHLRPRPMLMVQPKIDSAEAWSKERFAPMVRDTPVLRWLVRDPKSRSSENTLRMKLFPGGFLAIASANSPAELAARAVAKVYADEVDRFEESAGTEGDPVDLARQRMATVGDGQLVMTSTPGDKGRSRIEPAYLLGDQRKWLMPCPHCGHEQELVFGGKDKPFGLKWASGKPDTVQYLCESCAALIDERFKSQMNARARWVKQAPEHAYPSFFLNAFASPFGGSTWPMIVARFLEVKGAPLRLQAFVNTVLAETFEDAGERVDALTLLSRLEPSSDVLPSWVRAVTAGVDVQGSYLELWVWGWGAGFRQIPLYAEQIPGDPVTAGPWKTLEERRSLRFTNAEGKAFPIVRGFVDSGGHHTNEVYRWCRARQAAGWFACKGIGGEGIALLGKPSFQSHAKVMLYPIGTFSAKEEFLRSQIHVHEETEGAGGPGYVHLPDWLTAAQLEGLVSESLVTRLLKGKRHREWVKRYDQNEPLDCRVYARAALESLGLIALRDRGILERVQVAKRAHGPATEGEATEEPAPEGAPKDFTAEVMKRRQGRVPGRRSWKDRWRG